MMFFLGGITYHLEVQLFINAIRQHVMAYSINNNTHLHNLFSCPGAEAQMAYVKSCSLVKSLQCVASLSVNITVTPF